MTISVLKVFATIQACGQVGERSSPDPGDCHPGARLNGWGQGIQGALYVPVSLRTPVQSSPAQMLLILLALLQQLNPPAQS
jgi:hypothetical protein